MKEQNKNLAVNLLELILTKKILIMKYLDKSNNQLQKTLISNRLLLLSNCSVWGKKKSMFIKNNKLY